MSKDFLKTILAEKIKEVAFAREKVPESILQTKAQKMPAGSSLLKALRKPGPTGINIIAEIKRASPSKGDLKPDLEPAILAREYDKGKASAISVLTDQKFFKGSLADLQQARQATALPILRKEFIISAYQIYEAKVVGADSVLLIVRILNDNQLSEFIKLCQDLKIDALVEIHSLEELKRATKAGAVLIGINNRNLSSFKTDIRLAGRLASHLNSSQVAIAASGITGQKDIQQSLEYNIFNFLIGESLVKAENPAKFLNQLLNSAKSVL